MVAAWNLGLAPAFQPARRESTAIRTEGDYDAQNNAWLGDWQSRWDAATPVTTYHGPTREEYLANAMSSAAQSFSGSDFQYGQYLSDAFNAGGDTSLLSGVDMNYQQPFTVDDSARRALDAEKARQTSQWDLDRQTRQQNQQAQQQSYNQMSGGGFAGGIIDEGYSSPWSTGSSSIADPTQASPGASFGQPWATPGYGGPTGGGSVGGYSAGGFNPGGLGGLGGMTTGPTPPQQGGPSQGFGAPTPPQQGGFGGPFSNSNPWSPSS